MPDFSKARDPLDVLDMMTAPARAFADGVRAANDETNLCSRKLRIAIVALETLAMPAGGSAGLESAMEKAMRQAAQTALDRIAGLK
jgi:hypothetical protein